ncbi:SAF domain-containing protein [Thermophilibacter sp.]
MTRRFRLVVSGACALLAAALCLAYGQAEREKVERERSEALERYGGEVVSLVVATEGIEAGQVVDRGNVAERDWLADLAPEGAVTGIDAVLGSEVSVPVAAGAPLTDLNFRDPSDAVDVPADRVALSVPASGELGLPPATAPGDVLAAYEVTADGVRPISGDVQVLAVPSVGSGLMATGSVTVAVRPGEVARVLAASDEGSLRLALPGDEALAASGEAVAAPSEVTAETGDEGDGADATTGDAASDAEGTETGNGETSGGEGA